MIVGAGGVSIVNENPPGLRGDVGKDYCLRRSSMPTRIPRHSAGPKMIARASRIISVMALSFSFGLGKVR